MVGLLYLYVLITLLIPGCVTRGKMDKRLLECDEAWTLKVKDVEQSYVALYEECRKSQDESDKAVLLSGDVSEIEDDYESLKLAVEDHVNNPNCECIHKGRLKRAIAR